MASAPTLVMLDRRPDPADAVLTLISDLSKLLPSDLRLDFDVQGFSLDKNYIGIALDGNEVQHIQTQQVQLRSLSVGYHLIRAFLIYSDFTCVKTTAAYVEAEFFVQRSLVQLERPFMFGQPSIIVVLAGRLIDFFVHNCVVSPRTYYVRVLVDGVLVAEADEWATFELQGISPGEHSLRVVLTNTFGEELSMPRYNSIEHRLFIN